jgi:hypothetical protein
VQYWQQQILTGAVSVGSAVYDIANGATGADATVLTFKVEAGLYFTTQTQAANIGSTAASVSGNTLFIPVATDTITHVVDQASETASQANTDKFVASGGTVDPYAASVTEYTLTAAQDTFTTSTAGVLFNAPLQTSNNQFSSGSNTNLQTLTPNDSLVDSVGDGKLNVVFNQTGSGSSAGGNPATGTELVVPGVTLQGVPTATLTSVTDVQWQGFQGNVIGLTTVNVPTSLAGILLGGDALTGSSGNGLNTALTNVNVTNFAGGIGQLLFGAYIAAAAGSATNTINVTLSGLLGSTNLLQAVGGADSLFFGADGNPGVTGAPSVSYGTWALTVNSNANLQLWQNGVGAATAVTLAGPGNVSLGQDVAGNWQNLTSIDASASTGNVTITGFSSEDPDNIGNLFIPGGVGTGATGNNPYGLFGAAAGLLDGNTALTSYKFSTGVNFLDVASFGLANLANLVTTPGANAKNTNTIVVNDPVATTIVASTFAGIKGFQILGVDNIGGTINYANLPSSIYDIVYQNDAASDVTINNAPAETVAAPFIVDTEDNGTGYNLTVNAANQAAAAQAGNIVASALEIIVGAATRTIHEYGWVGAVTLTGEETVTISSVAFSTTDPLTNPNVVGDVSLTPGAPYLHEYLTLSGSANLNIGSIQDYAQGQPAGTLNINDLVLSVTDTGIVNIYGEVNAVQILAATSGGLIMHAADNNFTAYVSNNGDLIIGSQAGSNVLIGSIGNDSITGTTSTSAVDTIATSGGADSITLAQGHGSHDHIELYTGAGLFVNNGPGGDGSTIVAATVDSIVDANDTAQAGWWGVNTSGLNNNGNNDNIVSDLVFQFGSQSGQINYGTSQNLTTVTNFSAAHDVVDISVGAFGWNGAYSLLENVFCYGNGGVPSDVAVPASVGNTAFFTQAVFTAPVIPGQDVTYLNPTATSSANVLVLSGVYANASAVAQTVGSHVGFTAINFHHGLALNLLPGGQTLDYAGHLIIAYQNQGGSTVLADLSISADQQVVYDTYSGVGPNGNNSGNSNYGGTNPNEVIGVSDLVQLTGVSLNNLHTANIHFVA